MPKIAAAHCNPKIKPALNHNDRTNDTAHTINKERMHLNEYSKSSEQVRKEISELYEKAKENFARYCEQKNGLGKNGKPKGLQNFTKKEKCYHEFIYEIDENTTMEQCQELTEKIAKLTGFTPLQVVIHRDESFKDEQNGTEKIHYHAHAVFFTLDQQTGLQLARQEASLHKGNLSKIQTLTAETLKMQRGEARHERGEKQPQYIQNYKDYARLKEQERKLKAEIEQQRLELKQQKELLDKQAQELSKMSQELTKREQLIQEQQKDIKEQQRLLKLQQEAYEKRISKLELDHAEAISELKQKFNDRKSLLKNIITFGGHYRQIEKDKQEALSALLAINEKESDRYERKLSQLKKELERTSARSLELERNNLEIKSKLDSTKKNYDKVYTKLNEVGSWLENNIDVEQWEHLLPKRADNLRIKKLEERLNLNFGDKDDLKANTRKRSSALCR